MHPSLTPRDASKHYKEAGYVTDQYFQLRSLLEYIVKRGHLR